MFDHEWKYTQKEYPDLPITLTANFGTDWSILNEAIWDMINITGQNLEPVVLRLPHATSLPAHLVSSDNVSFALRSPKCVETDCIAYNLLPLIYFHLFITASNSLELHV